MSDSGYQSTTTGPHPVGPVAFPHGCAYCGGTHDAAARVSGDREDARTGITAALVREHDRVCLCPFDGSDPGCNLTLDGPTLARLRAADRDGEGIEADLWNLWTMFREALERARALVEASDVPFTDDYRAGWLDAISGILDDPALPAARLQAKEPA